MFYSFSYFSLIMSIYSSFSFYLFVKFFQMEPIDPQKLIATTTSATSGVLHSGHVRDPRSPTETVVSGSVPISSIGTSREEEDDSSNQNSSDNKSSGHR